MLNGVVAQPHLVGSAIRCLRLQRESYLSTVPMTRSSRPIAWLISALMRRQIMWLHMATRHRARRAAAGDRFAVTIVGHQGPRPVGYDAATSAAQSRSRCATAYTF